MPLVVAVKAMEILTWLYAFGPKLAPLALLLQTLMEAVATFITEGTALIYGRSAAATETGDEVLDRLTPSEKDMLAKCRGLAGGDGVSAEGNEGVMDVFLKLLAIAEKYPALMTLIMSIFSKK